MNNARAMRILGLIFLIVIMLWLNGGLSARATASVSTGKGWTVYGSMSCGFTRKQLDYMKKNGVDFTYRECDGGKCPGVEAFPTLVSPDGEKIVGYTEM